MELYISGPYVYAPIYRSPLYVFFLCRDPIYRTVYEVPISRALYIGPLCTKPL